MRHKRKAKTVIIIDDVNLNNSIILIDVETFPNVVTITYSSNKLKRRKNKR